MEGSQRKPVVLIHCIMNSTTNLKDSIEYYSPDLVYLITPTYYKDDKPDYAYDAIKRKEIDTFGRSVRNIKNCKIIDIKDAWHKSTIIETQEKLTEIKLDAENYLGTRNCRIIAGLSDAPPLVSVGIAQASIVLGFETYYTRGRRTYYEDFVIEIDDIGAVARAKAWLSSSNIVRNNLRYLKHIIELEKENDSVSTNMLQDKISTSAKSMHNAINKLREYGLIKVERKRDKIITSTPLGNYIMNTEHFDK